ncbi:MAG: hypothetical protein K8W52_40585 [Deltaproteobacteria bacterium]|nr:hypothetical protein [Deltaproteobacteria bacterium]
MAGNDGADARKPYKRSWKNLLINKQYQLRFTLFMVGLSAVLISALGWWVMRVASEATNVAIGQVQGDSCPAVPSIAGDGEPGGATMPAAAGSAAAMPVAPAPTPTPTDGSGSGSAGSGTAAAPEPAEPADPDAEDSARRRRVVIDDSSMTITQVLPDGYAEAVTAHWTCELEQSAAISDLEGGRRQILFVMVATGLFLVIALAIYGIKTTHKVAGPLHKVTLYFAKMRDGRLDKVWPLRKGDQLVAFYDHFRAAHAGVVELEKADIAKIRAVLDAAKAGNASGTSPEVDAAIAELTALVERKEKALV